MREQRDNPKFGLETFLSPWPAFPLALIAVLVGSFFYVWLRVEPFLEYHSFGPYFYQQHAFLQTFLGRPGGIANYAGIYLAQFNALGYVGPLVFVIAVSIILLVTLVCLSRVSSRPPGFVALVPLFVLLLLRNRYGCPVSTLMVGLFLALVASAALQLRRWRSWLWILASGLSSALLFYVAGLWSALLFAFLCFLFAVAQRRDWLAGIGCLVLSAGTPLLALASGNFRMAELLEPWPEGIDWVLASVLYASVPVVAVVLLLLDSPSTEGRRSWVHRFWFGQSAGVLVFVLGWAAVWLTLDRHQKLLAEIDYAAGHGDYQGVLAAVGQIKALNDPAKTRLQLALYHTGRLAEDLFSFHNLVDESSSGIGEECRAQSDLLFELGLINDAEHMACEALVMQGERPDLLRLLAHINLLKDRPEAAQVFLNVLSLVPFQGERANDAWPRVDSQTLLTHPAFQARIPAPILTNDVLHDGLPLGRLLDVQLALNPTNQMAFEYLMASYLLDLDLKKAVEHLATLNNFSYARIPRSYEEALLLFQELEHVQVDLRGRTIRSETAERFNRFKQAVKELKAKPNGRSLMAAQFGDTYWYYYASRSGQRPTGNPPPSP